MSELDFTVQDEQCLKGTTVLLVEDEVRFSRILQRFLKLSGVSSIEAVDGGQAIRILQEDGDRVDAVLTDLKMPVVSGWELIAVLRECRPHLPVVAMSATDPPPALLGWRSAAQQAVPAGGAPGDPGTTGPPVATDSSAIASATGRCRRGAIRGPVSDVCRRAGKVQEWRYDGGAVGLPRLTATASLVIRSETAFAASGSLPR